MLKKRLAASANKTAPAKTEVVKKAAAKPVKEAAPKQETVKTEKAKSAQQVLVVKSTAVDADGKYTGEPVESSDIKVLAFATEPAKVTVGNKLKVSDGNYGSAEIFVSLSVPCYVEEIDTTYERTSKMVDAILAKEKEKLDISGGESEESEEVEADEEEAAEDEDAEEAEESEDGDITEEAILAMDKKQITNLIKEYSLEIDTKGKKLPTIKKEIIALLSEDEEAEEESEESDDVDLDADEEAEESDESEEEESEEAEDEESEEASDEPYTEAELKGADFKDLKEVATQLGIKVKVKLDASPKDKKAAYVKAILDYQDNN